MVITTVKETDSGLNVVKYEPNELLSHLYKEKTKLAIVPTDVDSSIRRRLEGRLDRITIIPDGIPYFLYHDRNIEILNPPRKGSEGSAAKYYIWDNETGLLLQYIPTNSSTSCNFHTKGPEKFYNIEGDCRVCVCRVNNHYEGDKTLRKESLTVSPYHSHKLHSSSESVINIILMPPGVGTSDHNYPEKCMKDLYLLPEKCISYVG